MKEKFKRLQDTYTGTQHTNSLLGEKLHSATESLSSERKYMVQRITHLSTELEQANATVASLENINVSTAPSTEQYMN
ncbi:tight junction-associated protein 1-like [Coregonus clupeaformis]|uniref:tight junction-associated protein 1-like n=1 Tax=Coregonus clupeaformis TaxID=59861 RepID=UPI001E1C92F9|nr:tight junction-associated protein 1-like [Coregonus clupeaformis]